MTDTWQPSGSLDNLQRRSEMIRRLREYFYERGYWEVETPLLSRETVVDRFLEPIRVAAGEVGLNGLAPQEWYLQTSPEFAMKRLVAAGAKRIFQIGKAFRQGESGALHNPEFTLLEWYDAEGDYLSGRTFLANLATEFLGTGSCDERSYSAAFQSATDRLRQHGLDPLLASREELLEFAIRHNSVDETGWRDSDRENLLNLIWHVQVEPQLGTKTPLIIYDWPGELAALAQTRSTASGLIAERFELYFQGIELANGYHELADETVLARRFVENNQSRLREGRLALPVDSKLRQALKTRPRLGVGVALGVDRLVMLAMGFEKISDVIAFPADRA